MANQNPMMQMGPGRGPGSGHGPMARMNREKVKLDNPKATLLRMLGYMKTSKAALVVTFALCMVTALVAIVATRLNGYTIDNYIQTGDMSGLMRICLVIAAIYIIGVVSTFIQNRLMVKVAQMTSAAIRKDLYLNLQRLSISYYDTHSSGDLMSRITNDVDNINMTLSQSITQLFTGVVNIVGMSVAMLIISPILFGAGMVTLPLVMLASRFVIKKAQPYFVQQQKQLGRLNGYIEERISGQKLVLLFNKEEEAKQEFATMNQKLKETAALSQAISGTLGPVNNMINNLTYFIVAVVGAYLYIAHGDITIGVIFTFIIYMRNFVRPLNQLMGTFNTVQAALAGAQRVFEVIDETKEDYDSQTKIEYDLKGEVELSHVNFSYRQNTPILKDISLFAHPGKVTAIVGPTGSGKTTIVNLLTRFYDVDSGTIAIDSCNIGEYDKRGLRRSVAMVLQDTFLFNESIGQNIRYGRLDASDDEIIAAAKIANAHQFVMQLPEGYNTVLSGNGANLSQGQRQLLAIARAVLAQSAILILDEATSSIDTQTEKHIQEAMLKLMAGKTTFIIAHRLSTIRNADEILVLKDGEIIERGNHSDLLEAAGFYATLCQSQYRGIQI